MKLTKKLEADILNLYNKYWDAYLNGKMRIMSSVMDENIHVIGSAAGEVFKNKKETVKYYKTTADQVAGKAEMRNRNISLITSGSNVLVTEESDFYVLMDKIWTYYGPGRISTLFCKSNNKWKIKQQHGSLPDSRTGGGEQLNTDKIREENIRLKDAVKRRTIELEQKNRELEIEASLERVRARAMAMQKSDELSDLVDTVFKELTKLDFALSWCIINIIDESSLSNMVWAANPNIDKVPDSYHMKFENYPFHDAMMKGYKERAIKFIYVLEGNEKKVYDEYLFNETEFRKVPEEAQAASRAMEKYVCSFTFSNFGGLQTVGEEPLSDANLDILARFGKVFDLTYTRFNDLKQAEAQAREAQIETALERVRSRSMAMHSSDELVEASDVMFDQMKELGIKSLRIGIGTINDKDKTVEIWSRSEIEGKVENKIVGVVPFGVHPVFDNMVKAWREKKPYFTSERIGDEVKDYYKRLSKYLSYPLPKKFNKRESITTFFFKAGSLNVISLKPLKKEECDIMIRFAKVFDQTILVFSIYKKQKLKQENLKFNLHLKEYVQEQWQCKRVMSLHKLLLICLSRWKFSVSNLIGVT